MYSHNESFCFASQPTLYRHPIFPAPSAPQRPRVFITHHEHYKTRPAVELDFLWDPPAQPNGILSGYEVRASSVSRDGPWRSNTYNNRTTRHMVDAAAHDALYYYQVRACTVECGAFTSVVTADTTGKNRNVSVLVF